MQVKVSEASGAVLDWMVAKCEGIETIIDNLYDPPASAGAVLRCGQDDGDDEYLYEPSTDWCQGGPIIEREEIFLAKSILGGWTGSVYTRDERVRCTLHGGPTPLIAAMRCFVASKLGDEVEVPDELGDTT